MLQGCETGLDKSALFEAFVVHGENVFCRRHRLDVVARGKNIASSFSEDSKVVPNFFADRKNIFYIKYLWNYCGTVDLCVLFSLFCVTFVFSVCMTMRQYFWISSLCLF